MDKQIVVISLGAEGGRITVLGHQRDGVWSFKVDGVGMDLDENDEEVWRSWSCDATSLMDALPPSWWRYSPMKVHPQFADQIRREYERCRAEDDERSSWHDYGHERWINILSMRGLTEDAILAIQQRFHELIRERVALFIDTQQLELPELVSLLTSSDSSGWFEIPGVAGGVFSYRFEGNGEQAKLVTRSWCRFASGLDQQHEITAQGSKLVDEGFFKIPISYGISEPLSANSNRDDIKKFIGWLREDEKRKAQELLTAGDWKALNQLLVDEGIISI